MTACVHRWMLTSSSNSSPAYCLYCPERKTFSGGVPDGQEANRAYSVRKGGQASVAARAAKLMLE